MPRIIFCYSATECYCHYSPGGQVPMKEPTMHGESTQQKVSAVPSLGILQISKSKLTWKANHSISPSYKRQTGDSKDLEISNCKLLLVRETLF